MACKTSFELYHNFPKLAEESGFTFNTHKPRVHIEWNKIRLVDIESLIRERKFVILEQHINDILDCVLESEFDVRILDEGVLKIFRLAQLAVEYQQFCRHYLDRSVYVLREEVTVLAQELESTKRALKEKEEEIRRLRKRSKSAFRTSLPYGNENIATMILKTLNNRSDIFPTLTSPDTMQHNKCTYCDKVFLNQLYLQSHMSRRHSNMSEIPQKDVDNNQFERSNDEDVKLHNELSEMRSKLADMEQLVNNLKNTNSIEKSPNKNNNEPTNSKDVKDAEASKLAELQQLVTNLKNTMSTENKPSSSKEMKDAEVSTNSEGYILDKIEEWKKEERDKYNKEINLLRTQIIAMLDSFKERENDTTAKTDLKIMNELHATIKQQGVEILALKQELTNSKSNPNTEEFTQRKEMEEQMSYWVKRAESQSNEYKLLLQKLDVVAKEAEKSRALAESEKKRVLQLENLLREKIDLPKNDNKNSNDKVKPTASEIISIDPMEIKSNPKTNLIRDRISMKKLQQKAQELLDIQNTSTSDNSVSSDEKIKKSEKNGKTLKDEKKHDTNYRPSPKKQENRNKRKIKKSLRVIETSDHKGGTSAKDKSKSRLKENLHSKKENGRIIPGSPMKVIRAKITEEVNNRLVELGVDPLKTRLPENIFSKQKLQWQEQQQIKFKKNPRSEQVFHTLLTHLDSNATTLKADDTGGYDNTPTKNNKPFSLSSVISNVKTKALSLVKSNDHNKNEYKSYDNVAKKAMMLLRTPTSSTNSSPKIKAQNRDSPVKAKQLQNYTEKNDKNTNSKVRTLSHQETLKNYETDTDSSVSEINERDNYIKDQNQVSATIENLVKSPTRRPPDIKVPKTTNYTINTENKNIILQPTPKTVIGVKSNANLEPSATNGNSSDDVDSLVEPMPRRAYSVENITKLTKGVLKNASSTSSLNKKKVIFDMDAIQMKSVSASSPSQSVTEKDDNMEKYGLGLVNLDNDEWDISSIENEPVQKNPVISRTSPKIAELRETIESQLVRRSTLSTALVGGVDVLSAPSLKAAVGKGGSNTSLGSSILDDTDSTPAQNQVAFVKPRTFIEKDDSEIDISEFVTDELLIKNTNVIKT